MSQESRRELVSVDEAEDLSLPVIVERLNEAHEILAEELLPELQRLMGQALDAQGEEFPSVLRVLDTELDSLESQMADHVLTEERRLFPHIRSLFGGGASDGEEILADLRHEHENAAEILGRMRRVTGDYVIPNNDMEPIHRHYRALDAFEKKVREHIEVEEDVLIYRARKLKRRSQQ